MPVQEALGKDICLVNCVFCDSPKKRVFLWECCPLSFIAIPWGKHGDFGGFCCLCRLQSLQGGAPVDQIDKLTHILISGWCLVAHPTARKWVSSPQFFELINSIYPIYNWGYNPLTKWGDPSSRMFFGSRLLSGWWFWATYPSQKWWSSSVGIMKFPTVSRKSWKNPWFQSPPTSYCLNKYCSYMFEKRSYSLLKGAEFGLC